MADTLIMYISNYGAREVGIAKFKIPIINANPSNTIIRFSLDWSTLTFTSMKDQEPTPHIVIDTMPKSTKKTFW